MPAVNPRVNTVLDKSLYDAVERLAKKEGASMSQVVRDLVAHSLELIEDAGWEEIVQERKKVKRKFVTHAVVKKKLGIK